MKKKEKNSEFYRLRGQLKQEEGSSYSTLKDIKKLLPEGTRVTVRQKYFNATFDRVAGKIVVPVIASKYSHSKIKTGLFVKIEQGIILKIDLDEIWSVQED